MARHKIVAYKLTQKGPEVTVQALTESPRGTKTSFAALKFDVGKMTREEFTSKLEQDIKAMQAENGLPQ
jgi:hypothetical protein